jgi:hypothetical protein
MICAFSEIAHLHIPDAVQRETLHRRSGIIPSTEFITLPVLQRTTACCAAPGKTKILRYRSSGSRMKDRFCPGVATGLPWTSKPLLAAVSCGEPGAGEPSGCVSCALGTGTAAGPGGGSSGPARPQAERARTAKLKRTKPDMRTPPLVPAQAGTQRWIPACAGMNGNLVRSQFKPYPRAVVAFYHTATAGRHCVGQTLPEC